MPISLTIGSILAILLVTFVIAAWRGARLRARQTDRLSSAFDRAQYSREHGGGENQNFYFGQLN